MANVTYSAGIATAYGAAVRGGYTGTYDDFCRQQAEYAESAAAVEQAKEDAEAAASAADTSKTAAAGSASAAATSAGQASTSATNAANSATAANASKNAAATSATEAENAATSAAGSAATAQGVLESIPPSYDDLADEVADLKEELHTIYIVGENLFNPADATQGAWIDGTTGEVVKDTDSYWVSDFLDCDYSYVGTRGIIRVWYYNSDKTYRGNDSANVNGSVFNAQNAKYIRVGFMTALLNDVTIVKGSTVPDVTPYVVPHINNDLLVDTNASLNEINDSIDNIEDIVTEKLNAISTKTYHRTVGYMGGSDILYLTHIIKKGEQFVVEIIDNDGVFGDVVPFYLKPADNSDSIRKGSLQANIPTVFVAPVDIKSIYIYYGSSSIIAATGDFSINCNAPGDIEQRVITNTTDRFLDVPDYYFEDGYLSDKVESIQSAVDAVGGNGDVFIFITDEHWDVNAKRSVSLINYINNRINIPRLFSGGDTKMSGVDAELCSLLSKCFTGMIHHVVGNHEYLDADDGEIYRYYDLRGYNQIGNPSRHYYYVDNVQQKIRYIVLNSFAEVPSGGSAAADGYDATQLSWFESALQVDSGWTIIIFTHCLYHFAGDYSSMYPANQDFVDAIADYSGNGTIACVIQGHSHRDCIHYIGDNSIPLIITTCDKNTPWMNPSTQTYDINVDRTTGTINEQAFDVFVINKTSRQIKAIRVGAKALDGVDTTSGNPTEIRIVNY